MPSWMEPSIPLGEPGRIQLKREGTKRMKRSIPILAACLAAAAAVAQVATKKTVVEGRDVVRASDVTWGALNPARGAKGPRAGGLWNDRTADQASGFLVRFADGFASPPHIHNVTYRGVVISGLIHNDDPDAAEMWMPAGSFWTQPAGEVHITAAKGESAMAYIEIDSGPYLVEPKEEAFDKGERPVNVVPSNLVWLSPSETGWIAPDLADAGGESPQLAFLWGKPGPASRSGSFLRLPKGFEGEIRSGSGSLRIVVVKGEIKCADSDGDELVTLAPGEYFSVAKEDLARISCESAEGCVAYIQAEGGFVISAPK